MENYTKLSALGIELKNRNSGNFKTTCPKCSHTRKKKSDPCLFVNIDSGVYRCYNSGCDFAGFVGDKNSLIKKKVYEIPQVNNSEVSDKMLKWFKSRGISKSTVIRFGIKQQEKKYFPQNGKQRSAIVFPYIRDEKIVNLKYRDAEKNFSLEKGCELIFYNLDALKGTDSAIICEGEIDVMSFYEAGIYNVISVPNGASVSSSPQLEYLDSAINILNKKDKIIIAVDDDEPGNALAEVLALRLGKEKCMRTKWGNSAKGDDKIKDANDVLVKYGVEYLCKVFGENTENYPIDGVYEISSLSAEIYKIHAEGIPRGATAGFDKFDELVSFAPSRLTVITGVPSSGKSEFTDQLMIKLSVKHEWKWAIWSDENRPVAYHAVKLAEKLIEKEWHTFTFEELESAITFLDRFFFPVKIDNPTLDNVLRIFDKVFKRYGVKGCLIDPWTNLVHDRKGGISETEYIRNALAKVIEFTSLRKLHTFIVAHPTKLTKRNTVDGNDQYAPAELYDIAGSANWRNMCDNGISLHRDFENNTVRAFLKKIKYKFEGQMGSALFEWQKEKGGTYKEIL